jgi:23S rRNA pseudouridine1911/1915/1917 synthase
MPAAVDDAVRLDLWLARERGITRHAAQTLIAAGAVRVNLRPGRPGQRIGRDDRVEVTLPEPAAARPAVPVPAAPAVDLTVVYEDEWLAVIDKPAGLVVHPAPGHPHGTLADGLRQRGAVWSLLGGEERAGIVHRLDRDTSGLLVVAKTEAAHRRLAAQLQDRSLARVYWTLVHGGLAEATATVDAPIGRDRRDRKRMAVVDDGRPAVTDFRVLARHPRSTELEVRLRTGRTHQIRVHLAHIGHPVVGDPVYGRRADEGWRLALHACGLEFAHPADGRRMSFASELPAELAALRDAAREGRA